MEPSQQLNMWQFIPLLPLITCLSGVDTRVLGWQPNILIPVQNQRKFQTLNPLTRQSTILNNTFGLNLVDLTMTVACGAELRQIYTFDFSPGKRIQIGKLDLTTNKTVGVTSDGNRHHGFMPSAVCYQERYIYICGGRSSRNCSVYDIENKKWSLIDQLMPKPKYLHQSVVVDDRILLIGGYEMGTDGIERETRDVVEYDVKIGSWKSLAPMLEARSNFGAVLIPHTNGEVLVCGGAHNMRACEMFDRKANIWTPMAPMAHGRFDHGMVLFAGAVYIFGGFCVPGYCPDPGLNRDRISQSRLDSIEQYQPHLNRTELMLGDRLAIPSTGYLAVVVNNDLAIDIGEITESRETSATRDGNVREFKLDKRPTFRTKHGGTSTFRDHSSILICFCLILNTNAFVRLLRV